jgi:hypothetical protein
MPGFLKPERRVNRDTSSLVGINHRDDGVMAGRSGQVNQL